MQRSQAHRKGSKMGKGTIRVAIVAVVVLLVLGAPLLQSDVFAKSSNPHQMDATSSASLILDAPSGDYVVLINADRRPDQQSLSVWQTFFSGGEISYIFEDITCSVGFGDANGLNMAQSYQSRLPENQMTIAQEEATLMLSKAEHGRFDFIVMSAEFAASRGAETLYDNDGVVVLEVGDAQ